ncbi:MAG TPA: rod shape-determining protein MreD [Sphingobium sp.]|nr:rod shape-determining protein MreD [Sphingobium sp.]
MSSRYDRRIARPRHILHIRGTPVAAVLIGSMLPALLPFIAQSPLLPPFGFMIFIAWRLLREDIWPLWIGLPFGLFDDIMSGQPIGSAVFLWTVALLALELQSRRYFWRDYRYDWASAALAIAFVLVGGWLFVHLSGHGGRLVQIVPQMAYSICLFPLVVRLCAALDRWRLP